MPRTTIVVLNWNSCEMTAECIRSLLEMHTANCGIVVVDNGSRDSSLEMLPRQFPEIALLPQGRNLGFAAGCNIGIRYALAGGAEYVLLVNNDTTVDANLATALLDEAERHPGAGMVSPKIYYHSLPDTLWWAGGTFNYWSGIPKHVGLKKRDTRKEEIPREIEWATGCVVLIRTRALRDAGVFDEQFFGHVEDVDLSLRVRAAGYSIRYTPHAKVWHKEGVDYRKNVGEHARIFTGTRNLLWLMHKHATPLQWLTFLPNFLLRHMSNRVAKSLLRGDFRSAWAVFQGIGAFLRMRLGASFSPLPTELAASSREEVRAVENPKDEQKGLVDASRH